MNQAANRVARAIIDDRGRRTELIALLFEHDAPIVAAILGVLKAGKMYVPLDPFCPEGKDDLLTDLESLSDEVAQRMLDREIGKKI